MMKFKIVDVSEVTTRDGRKFNAYKTVAKDGRKMDVRFVRDCNNIPTKPCVILVEEVDANVDNTRQYPILWIKNVQGFEELERRNNLHDYFE